VTICSAPKRRPFGIALSFQADVLSSRLVQKGPVRSISFVPYSRSLEASLVVPEVDGRHVTDAEYPSAVTLSLIYREATVTPEALDFMRFIFTPKARTLIRNFGGVPVRTQS
jgi:hypothetical protein